jgi:hypothetical protein
MELPAALRPSSLVQLALGDKIAVIFGFFGKKALVCDE